VCRRANDKAIWDIYEWVIEAIKERGMEKEEIFEYLGFCQS
jgi:hypothetical protein